RWPGRLAALQALGIQAGWAQPILSARGRVLGTFAVYARAPVRPSAEDRALMERLTHITRIALEKFQAELSLERMANYDVLTGLPNRSLLLDRLDGALLRASKSGGSTALLLFNLDGMKQVNDALGYEFGDRFLKILSARLCEHLRQHRTFARVGGDEFGVVLEDLFDQALLPETVQELLEHITETVEIDGREMFVTASLGISVGPQDGSDADTLFKRADAALRRAKQQGRNGFQFYTADMNASAARRLALTQELRYALERGEFHLHYQPQLDLAGRKILGAEALLRWQSAEHGLVPPVEFIPLLEETALIIPVGEWVLGQACQDIARLRRLGVQPPHIAVNLSARQFRQPDLAERIEALLEKWEVPAEGLTLEITESLIMQEPQAAVQVLQRLKAIQLRISLDDFGTGYSSLSILKTFPIDELKIDKSFVDGVAGSAADAAIVDAIIRMAHSLNMKVVAEGVEAQPQLDFLEAHGCDQVQGFLIGQPGDVDDLRPFLATAHVADSHAAASSVQG
ncbi:MAG TPA: EAL domain-containing protein, partial [Gammaproteobacteria bacterium]|nr:EAL domain-containing protein [Gammaproteobacteria bacterium]